MYLKRFVIDGIKCFDRLEIDFPQNDQDYGGWVVLLGGNGVGKSTLLQTMALALVGPLSGQRLFRPEGWVREGVKKGQIQAEIIRAESDSQLGQPRKKPYEVNFAVVGNKEVEIDGQPYDQPQLVHLADDKERKALASGPYGAKRPGWFSCGYGPFRRLSGGETQAKVVYSPGREARFATLFFEAAALTQCLRAIPPSRLYADPDLRPTRQPGEITRPALTRMRSLVRQELRRLEGPAFDRCVGERLTERGDGGPTPRARRLSSAALRHRLASGAGLLRSPASRIAFVRRPTGVDLFVDGQLLPLPRRLAFAAPLLTGAPHLGPAALAPHLARPGFVALLADLVRRGAFVVGRR